MANVLLGVTGSVAAVRTPALYSALSQTYSVKVVATEPSLYFFDRNEIPTGKLISDADEWRGDRYHRDDPILHIELRNWADVFLIAPLDANTLSKIAHGLADNCLTCVARAWDLTRPLVLAPAMNTLMWEHPATVQQLSLLAQQSGWLPPRVTSPDELTLWMNRQRGTLAFAGPIEKRLACGEVGVGGMSEVADIVALVQELKGRYEPQ